MPAASPAWLGCDAAAACRSPSTRSCGAAGAPSSPACPAWELPTLRRSSLEAEGFEVIERRQPSLLLDGSVLITGEVDRTTDFEQGMPFHEAERDGRWEPDPLILDDQALMVHVRGKGLVVLTGCGHAGAVNICRYAMRLTGVDRLHGVFGGFHLTGQAFEPLIEPTVAALARAGTGPHRARPLHRLAGSAPVRRQPGRRVRAQRRRHVVHARGLSPVEGPYARRAWGGAGPSGSRCCAASRWRRARRPTTAWARRPIPRQRSRSPRRPPRRRPRRSARRRRHRPRRRPRRSRRPRCRPRPRVRPPTRPPRRGPSGTGSAMGRSRSHPGRTSSASPRDRCRSPPSTATSCAWRPTSSSPTGSLPASTSSTCTTACG